MPFSSKSYSCGAFGQVRKLLDLNHNTWSNFPVPQAVTLDATLLDIETAPNNGDHVFVTGEGATTGFYGVAVSNDGGTTWNIPGGNYQAVSVNNGGSFPWYEIVVTDPQIYGISGTSYIVGNIDIVSGTGVIAKSTDGGVTYDLINWSVPFAFLPPMPCTSVHFPNPFAGVVGLTDYIIKTVDGGNTWTLLNGGLPLSTAQLPNPPGTLLPIGPITGINMLLNQEHIIGVGADFIVSTEPVTPGSPTAGVAVDSWINNFITASGVPPPVNTGFTPNLPIGYHLNGLPVPNDAWIYVSGDAQLGIHSSDHGQVSWVNIPAPGWNPAGTGFSRRAAHFYRNIPGLEGFFNKDDSVYFNTNGFDPGTDVLSDTPAGGLLYTPTAVWTWYLEGSATCRRLENCNNPLQFIYTTSPCIVSAPIGFVTTLAPPYDGICWQIIDDGFCINPVSVNCVSFRVSCNTCPQFPPFPCECPQGTILVTLPDGTRVCRQDTVALAEPFDSINGCDMVTAVIGPANAGNFNQDLLYNQFGANVYQDIGPRPWPVTTFIDPLCILPNFAFIDNSAVAVNALNNSVNSLWGDGLSLTNGRHNNAAVWSKFWAPTTCAANPVVGLYGFTHCLTVVATSTYFFATSGRNFQLKINGSIAVENTSGTAFGTNNLHIFPITLAVGTYIIEMNGAEVGTGICNAVPPATTGFVWEIYNGVGLTGTSLAAMTTTIQLAAVTIYSTFNELGNKFDQGTVTFNNRCPQQGQALDNCFPNPLNPLANPNIYVCHSFIDLPISGCCYILTDCQNPQITYLTTTDLSIYVFQNLVINVAEYIGCFIVSLAPDCGIQFNPPVTVTQAFVDCPTCLPKCYILTDCDNLVPDIITNTDLSLFVGLVINIVGSSTCWTVTLAGGCQGSVSVVVTASFATCIACKPVCYLLINCQDPADIRVTNTDLSLYVNQVIYIDGCPGICWQVDISPNCAGALPVTFLTNFADCNTCLGIKPPPPLELRPRSIKPGYTTPGCDPAYTELVSCTFANAAYDEMLITRYGITMCCNEPIQKWDIKKQLLDLRALYDPELCKNTFDKCCPPCAMVAVLVLYPPIISCTPPTNMIAILYVPPTQCPAPINMQAAIVIPPTLPCICYVVNVSVPCVFNYTDCQSAPQQVLAIGLTYICSITLPTTACSPLSYTLQATAGDCLIGTCGP